MKIKINNAAGPQVQSQTKPSRLLPVMGILSFIAGLQVATQCFAYFFGYQPLLGSHIGRVYPPWGILHWASKWYDRYPDEFIRSGSLGLFCSTIGLLAVALVKVVTANTSKAHEYLHGSARWAGFKEIKAAGLLEGGVYVGGWMDKSGKFYYLRHDGPEHILTYAPTRSGKGVGLVIPTLLSWPSSCVITDLKGELWALTAGWRKQHAKNKVLLFEPAASERGLCWNPLDEIRINTDHEVGDVQNLANLVVDPDGKGLESHWQKTAFALFVGLILHALYKAMNSGSMATLSSIDAMLADPTRDIADLWTEMITYKHLGGRNHPAVGSAARDMMDRPEEEAGSVLSTAKSYLVLYRDPIVAENVSKSEFRIKDLMHHDDPVSLYIVTQPNDKARLRPLVRILVNMIVRLSADKLVFKDGLPVGQYKHRLLVMLDEFPSLGRLEILQESLAFVAGYGIKCYLICQDINQLKSRETGYGHDESITSNCHVQNAFPPNRIETAEHLSRLTGQTTVIKEQITTSGHRTAAMMGHVSRTIQEVQRALLTPDECLRMPGPRKNAKGEIEEAGDMVISVAGFPAIYGRQPLYFKDPVFAARAAIPAPDVSDKTVDRSHIGVIKL
ncbi:MAG: type IV secretory system conjugative DNA transfer family protein [Pseudomonadota bacterium]